MNPFSLAVLRNARLALAALIVGLLPTAPALAQRLPGEAAPPGPTAVLVHAGGRCLEAVDKQVQVDGARVQLGQCDGQPNQVWRLERSALINQANGRCLDVHGPDVGLDGARLQTSRCQGSPNQQWRQEQGQLISQADGRCLEAFGAERERGMAHVQTWACQGTERQRWAFSPAQARQASPAPALRNVEAGPLWNDADANQKCPAVCGGNWSGQWHTTVPGRMSVCTCLTGPRPWAHREGPNGLMSEAGLDELLQAMAAEPFSQHKLAVLEMAARDNRFTGAQLRRVLQGLSFPTDRVRAVELLAPRLVDMRDAHLVYGALEFDIEREQVRAILDKRR